MAKGLTEKDYKRIEVVKSKGTIPQHIAIIMDGNGRWARQRGLPRVAGHQKGVESVRQVVESCARLGVKYLTLYTFSTENWNRPQEEVSTLMRLIVKSLQNETDELHANNIKLTTIGNTQSLPAVVQRELNQATQKTKNNTAMTLILALSYSGRWEILDAVKKTIRHYNDAKFKIDDINENIFSAYLNTAGIPDPDLLIRSGGELRISNFLLWQIAYSEIYVTEVLWPEFRSKELLDSIFDFHNRERRFGLVSEQISKNSKKIQNVKKLPKQVAEI